MGAMAPPFEPYPDGWCYRYCAYGLPYTIPNHPQSPFAFTVSGCSIVIMHRPPGRFGHFSAFHQRFRATANAKSVTLSDCRGVEVPRWFVVIEFLVLPVWRLTAIYRVHQRGKRGKCIQCGFSLAGNVSGVCPECGTSCLR